MGVMTTTMMNLLVPWMKCNSNHVIVSRRYDISSFVIPTFGPSDIESCYEIMFERLVFWLVIE